MNQKQLNCLTPVLTSKAGACLTLANWQEIGIDTVSYYLDALLIKPGLSLLNTLTNLRSYCGWQGAIVLNATLAVANEDGIYTIRSRYDGSLLRIHSTELFSLILSLQPDIIILPAGLATHPNLPWHSLPNTVKLCIPANETLHGSTHAVLGTYLQYDKATPFFDFAQQIRLSTEKPIYVAGELNLSQARALSKQGVLLLESDTPARDGRLGQIYNDQGTIDLLDSEMAFQQELLDANCSCPTCSQRFTRAYLHHLLLQTPLLCQRFLIQHNTHYYRNVMQG